MPTVGSTISKYSYGITVHKVWDEKKFLAEDKWQDPVGGTWRAKNQMNWLINCVRFIVRLPVVLTITDCT